MIEFMDEIVEAVEQFAEGMAKTAIIILGILAKTVIIITAPAWILPYKAIKEMLKRQKGAGGND